MARKRKLKKKKRALNRGTRRKARKPARQSSGKGRPKKKVPSKRIKPKGTRKSTKKRPPIKRKRIKKRLDQVRQSELILGRPEGTDEIDRTEWLTPTKKGFNVVESMMREAIRNSKGVKGAKTVEVWHYTLRITFTGPHGKVINEEVRGAGLPLFPWIAKRTRNKEEQVIQAARDLVRTSIYQLLSKHFDIISPGKAPKSEKMSSKQAEKKLRDIRKGRNTRFQFILFRTSVKRKRGRK